MRRSLLSTLVASLALAVGVVATPAVADPVEPLVASVQPYSHAGETVHLTATLTNTEAVAIDFAYMAAVPYTWTATVDFVFTGCTGDISWCSIAPDGQTAAVHPGVVIAPGATRTVTFAYELAADTPCDHGRTLQMFVYGYTESAARTYEGFAVGSGFTEVIC